jgi:hypothetical protein
MSEAPIDLKTVILVGGWFVSYFCGRASARDGAARKVVAEDIGSLLTCWCEFSKDLAIHQTGNPVRKSANMTASRKILAQEMEKVKELRVRAEYMIDPSHSAQLFEDFQQWLAGAMGDKGIISGKTYAFTPGEVEAFKKATESYMIGLSQLRLKILAGKTKLRFGPWWTWNIPFLSRKH